MQENVARRNSNQNEVEKIELRNKSLEKHKSDLEENAKNLNGLLMQERAKVFNRKFFFFLQTQSEKILMILFFFLILERKISKSVKLSTTDNDNTK